MVEAGGLVFVSYCAGNIEGTTTEQVQGALDNLESRLTSIGLSLAASSRSTRSSPTSGRSR
jgi:enamine deaminase RidA (YjgF/YER057c/UK114 family)